MIPKSGGRFSEKIMRHAKSMIPKSGGRFSEKIMRNVKSATRSDLIGSMGR
jgi:hypothetical protein